MTLRDYAGIIVMTLALVTAIMATILAIIVVRDNFVLGVELLVLGTCSLAVAIVVPLVEQRKR